MLAPVVALVGARGAAIVDSEGTVVAQHAPPADGDGGTPVQVEQPGAKLIVWTSPYAPFFGDDELRILETVTAMTGIALDRVRLFEQEHSSRLALERANEVMANFVALAAHELRTPVTTVHGFVQTLNHLGDRLDESQKHELRVALEQQTARMAGLVEQLLDLSRLDAHAIDIAPQAIRLRSRLAEVVTIAAGSRAGEIEVSVSGPDEAVVDPAVLDHIVTNLVTNALAVRAGARARLGRGRRRPAVRCRSRTPVRRRRGRSRRRCSSASPGPASHATAWPAPGSASRSRAPTRSPTGASCATSGGSRLARDSWSSSLPYRFRQQCRRSHSGSCSGRCSARRSTPPRAPRSSSGTTSATTSRSTRPPAGSSASGVTS